MTRAAVSAIVPVYEGERYLADAIRSILDQARPPDEVIVIDDGSTDGSAAIAEGFGPPVRCERRPHGGIGAARTAGLALARGERIAFLDADDLWLPEKLDRQGAALDAEPAIDMVFGHVRQFLSPDLDDGARRRFRCPPDPAPGYVAGAGLFRRSAFERVGPFETCWRVGEFVSWYRRAVDAGLRSALLPDLVLLRRIHATNTGIRERTAAATAYVRILTAALDERRRGAPGPQGL